MSQLGKLQYFTNLNLAAIKGDDVPNPNHDSRVRDIRVRSSFQQDQPLAPLRWATADGIPEMSRTNRWPLNNPQQFSVFYFWKPRIF